MPLDDNTGAPAPDAAAAAPPTQGLIGDQIARARRAGYSDADIGAYLQQSKTWAPKFKQAADAGYSSADVLNHLGLALPRRESDQPDEFRDTAGQGEAGALANAAAQGFTGAVGSTLSGYGRALQEGGRQNIEQALSIMGKIDSGQTVPPDQDVIGYGSMTDAQKTAYKERLQADAKIAESGAPSALTQAGENVTAYGQQNFKVAPNREGIATGAARMVGGLPVVVGGAVAGSVIGGPAGGLAGAGAAVFGSAYDGAYKDAIAKGASADDADKAALASAAGQAAMMAAPVGRLIQSVPAPLREGVVRTMVNLAKHGVEFGGFNAMSTFVNNLVARETYDPNKKLMDGVGDAAAEGFVAGLVVPGTAAAARGAARAAGRAFPQGVSPELRRNLDALETDAAEQARAAPGREPPEAAAPAEPPPPPPKPPATMSLSTSVTATAPSPGEKALANVRAGKSALDGLPVKTEPAPAPAPPSAPAAPPAAAPVEAPPAQPEPPTAPTAPAEPAAPPRIRTVEQIMQQEGVSAKKAAAIQNDEILARGHPITDEERQARAAGVGPAPSATATPAARASIPEEARTEAPASTETTTTMPGIRADDYRLLSPDEINVDPERFQYKTSDEKGVTGELSGAKWFERVLSNPITAWQDTDGKVYVVNGHQRTDLAKRAQAAGQPDVQVPAQIFKASDGYTPEFMKVLGAYQNIAEGSGNALDAARILRSDVAVPEGMRLPELPVSKQLVRDGNALRKLSDQAFGMVENGLVPATHAARVGEMLTDQAEQLAMMGILAKHPAPNPEQARFMVQDYRNAGFLRAQDEGQGQIPGIGGDQAAQSLVPQRAQVFDAAIRKLSSLKRVTKAAIEGEADLTALGNKLDTEANTQARTENERLIDAIKREATVRGPISDALSEAARELAEGKPAAATVGKFLAAVRAIRSRPDEGAEPRPDLGGADAAVEGQDGLTLSHRDAEAAAAAADRGTLAGRDVRERLARRMTGLMRQFGLPPEVGLRLVEQISGGRANAAYDPATRLIRFALDTAPHEFSAKLFHEVTHALMDPALGLLRPREVAALNRAGDAYLARNGNRARLARLYGADPKLLRAEAIAELAEHHINAARYAAPFLTRVYDRMANFVQGLRQALHGEGFKTAEDVFRAVLRGDIAKREGRPYEPAAAEPAVESAAPQGSSVTQAANSLPESYFSRRAPLPPATGPDLFGGEKREREKREAVPTYRTDPNQQALPGMSPSAAQAQAARDQAGRGALLPKTEQKPADEGLFARPQPEQPELPQPRVNKWPSPEGFRDMLSTVPDHAPHEAHGTARDWVLSRGRDNGNEHVAIVENATGRIVHAGTSDQAKWVQTPPFTDEAETDAYTLHHNHPGSSSFSDADLMMLMRPGLSHVLAHGHDGTTFTASVGPYLRDLMANGKPWRNVAGYLDVARRLTDMEVFAAIAPTLTTPESAKAANLAHADIIARALHQRGLLDYMVSRDLPEEFAGVMPVAVRALDDVSQKLEEIGRDRLPDVGPARPVRADEQLARLPQGVGARPAGDEGVRGNQADHRAPQERGAPGPSLPLNRQGSLFSLRDDGELPTLGALREPLRRQVVEQGRNLAEIGRGDNRLARALFPMAQGTKLAQAIAFKFANAIRGVDATFHTIDRQILNTFTAPERAAMGRALDNQSVFEQLLRRETEDMAPSQAAAYEAAARQKFDSMGIGLAGLSASQREMVESLHALSQKIWQRMKQRGLVSPNADPLPYYMPRMGVALDPEGKASRMVERPDLAGGTGPGKGRGAGLTSMDQKGRNWTTAGPMLRKYLTREEYEAAIKARFGENAQPIDDIRALVIALARNERAVAGRDMVDAIKRYGEGTIEPTVQSAANPRSYFTLEHPALLAWRPKLEHAADGSWQYVKDANGKTVMEPYYLHVSNDFKGPLNAVLTQPAPDWYRSVMALKSASMHVIMASPFTHLNVELGRAFPIMKGSTFTVLFNGKADKALNDPKFMANATSEGLAPIAYGWRMDPTTVQNDTLPGAGGSKLLAPWRAWEAMHERLLWNNVRRLQVGIYTRVRDEFIDKGLPARAAGIAAAHIANRFAGALPPENMSRIANMTANLLLFSRSYTIGNLGVLKDMFNGAPSHVRALIEHEFGADVAKQAQGLLRRKARAAVAIDMGINRIGNALLQSAFKVGLTAGALGLSGAVANIYEDWLDKTKQGLAETADGNLFGLLRVFPQANNEPGKTDRAFAGTDAEGRGIYVKPTAGRIGGEFENWLTNSRETVLNKLSPWVRPAVEILFGHDARGYAVLRPDPKTPGDYLSNWGRIIDHVLGNQMPTGLVSIGHDIANRTFDPSSWANLAGSATGLYSLSHGSPYGPEGAEAQSELRQHDFDRAEAIPQAYRMLRAGDKAGAEKLMQSYNLTPREIAGVERRQEVPQYAKAMIEKRAARLKAGQRQAADQ